MPDDSNDALIAAANAYHEHEAWAAALPLWSRIADAVTEQRDAARRQHITCLLNLGRHGEVKRLCDAPDAPVEVLMVAGKFYDERRQWTEALPLHERIAAMSTKYRDIARRRQVGCLLNLARHAEARALYEAADTPVEILMAAGKFYDAQKQWTTALPLHERIAALSAEYRSVARGRQVTCLLNLGREDEARAIYEASDAPPEVARAAADFFDARD
jgi:hypothetical protein